MCYIRSRCVSPFELNQSKADISKINNIRSGFR